MKRVALVALAVSACSPFGTGAFHCAEDGDCKNGDTAGYCEQPAGLCAFDDGACDSGRRFGASSGGVANQCVTAENLQPDAGTGSDDADPSVDADFTGCYGTGPVRVCPADPLTQPLTVGVIKTYDTGATSADCLALRAPGTLDVCAIGGSMVTINAAIAAAGARPFVIVSAGDLTVSQAIDVSSLREQTGRLGAGATVVQSGCSSGTIMAGGGGAGGSYSTVGGAGGAIEGNANQQMAGAAVAFAFGGGCPGHEGSPGTAAGTGGVGGVGGGAIALIATGMITIGATVSSGGQGGATGATGTVGGGGGGGGAGGTILLDAAHVMINADVFANGGAGAEGNSAQVGTQGCNGGESTSVNGQATVACDILTTAGNGGKGAAGNMPSGPGTAGNKQGNPTSGGGGGGGGGLGVIEVVSPNPLQGNGMLSPPAS